MTYYGRLSEWQILQNDAWERFMTDEISGDEYLEQVAALGPDPILDKPWLH